MSRTIDLVTALRAVAPAGINSYPSEAPSEATLPWLVLNITLPDSTTSEAGEHLAGTGSLLVTVATLTEDATVVWVDKVLAAWRGKKLAVPGWQVGTLLQRGEVVTFPDTVTITNTNRRVSVAKVRFTFTCSPTT